MEKEWISKQEYMNRNHIGQTTMLKLMHEEKVEYQKIGKQYKIRISKNEQVNQSMENLIRENEELKTYIKTLQNVANQIKI